MSKHSKKSGATIKVAEVRGRVLAGKASRAHSGLGATISVLDAMDATANKLQLAPKHLQYS